MAKKPRSTHHSITEEPADQAGSQQERFQVVIETLPGAVVAADQAGRITLANAKVEEMFGYQPDELIGQPIEILLPERFRGGHTNFRTKYFANPGPRSMGVGRDLAGLRKDGSEFPVEIGLNTAEVGGEVMAIAFITDITERVKAEQEIRQSEERFRTIVDTIPGAVVAIDPKGNILMANPTATAIFGYTHLELIGRPVEMLLPERFRKGHDTFRTAYFSDPSPRSMGVGRDLAGLRKDGTEFPVEIGLSFTDTVEGPLALAFITDITERAKAAQELRDSEARFRTIVDSIPGAVVAIGAAGNILMVNPTASQIFGYTPDELTGKSVDMLLPDQYRDGHVMFRTDYFANPTPRPMGAGRDLSGRRKDGTTFPVEIGLSYTETRDGPMALAFITDITERKHAELTQTLSDRRFRNTVDSMAEGFQIISFDWRYLHLNNEVAKQGHATKEELIGKTMMEAYPGIDQSPLFVLLRKCMEERTPQTMENLFEYPDGGTQWFELRIQPVDEGILILSNDITERKVSELEILALNAELEQRVQERTAELEASERKFYKAFASSPAGISIASQADGRWIEVNDALTQMTGYSREEMIGHTAVELGLVDAATREKISEATRQYGMVRSVEVRVRTKSGEMTDVLLSTEQIDLAGQPCVLSIQYDISKRKRAEAQIALLNRDLIKRQTALEAANKELEAFSYSVSHDLRAPLRAVDGFSRIIEEDYTASLDADGHRYLGLVRDNVRQMGRLIDDLLAFSRLGRQQIARQKVDMGQLARDTLTKLPDEDGRKAAIEISDLPEADGDSALLRQVLMNLIGNALKFTRDASPPRIEVGHETQDGETVYFVKDNGAGFDMQYESKLFGVFQRLHRVEEFEGTGVGLAICQRIVQRHGGRIWADAGVGKGATFFFTIGRETGNEPTHEEGNPAGGGQPK